MNTNAVEFKIHRHKRNQSEPLWKDIKTLKTHLPAAVHPKLDLRGINLGAESSESDASKGFQELQNSGRRITSNFGVGNFLTVPQALTESLTAQNGDIKEVFSIRLAFIYIYMLTLNRVILKAILLFNSREE